MQTTFDAVILAGLERKQPNPLLAQSGVTNKVLLPVAGRPMIDYVVRALADSKHIGQIVIVGLAEQPELRFPRSVHYLPDQGSMLKNMAYGFGWLASQGSEQRYGLLATGDIPLITGAMIDWFINACQPLEKDVDWGTVEQRVMEATFPNSKRSYLRLVEGKFCSGDLFLGKLTAAQNRQTILGQMIEQRKSVWQQVRLLGLGVVIKFLFRRLHMQEMLALFPRLLGLQGAAIVLPFAEVGMDVDKPHQLAQVEAYLAQRASKPRTLAS